MSFGEAISSVFSKYATFSGRACRSEYWYFYLFNFLIGVVLVLLSRAVEVFNYVRFAYSLAVFIPGIAVTVRRLHDIGKSGWTYLLVLFPIILLFVISVVAGITGGEPGITSLIIISVFAIASLVLAILFLIWLCRDSQPGTNQYGPNPKEMPNSDPETTV